MRNFILPVSVVLPSSQFVGAKMDVNRRKKIVSRSSPHGVLYLIIEKNLELRGSGHTKSSESGVFCFRICSRASCEVQKVDIEGRRIAK